MDFLVLAERWMQREAVGRIRRARAGHRLEQLDRVWRSPVSSLAAAAPTRRVHLAVSTRGIAGMVGGRTTDDDLLAGIGRVAARS